MGGALTRMLGRTPAAGGVYGGPFTTVGKLGDPAGTGTGNYSAATNELSLRSVLIPSGGNFDATSFEIELGASVTNGTKIKAVIYTDSAGSPGSLVITGTEVTLATADANTTKTLSLGATQTLTAGVTYWIGAIYNNTFTWRGIGGTTKWKANTYASGAPASPTGFSSSSTRIIVRVNGTASTGLLGNWDVDLLGTNYNMAPDEVDLVQITMPSSGYGTPASIFARMPTAVTAGDKFKAVIYTDSGGSPSALVATGAEYTIGAGDINKQVEMAFSSPPNLSASTAYWIGVHASGGTDVISNSGGTAKFKAATYGSGPPSSISSPSSSPNSPGFYLKFT